MCRQEMFKQYIKEVLHQVDPEANFIYHGSLIKKVDLLTLVKKKKNTLFSTDYEVMDVTFAHLLPEFASFSEYTGMYTDAHTTQHKQIYTCQSQCWT